MKFILGTKLGMTQVFRADGTVVPVTRVKAGPCVVTQVKSAGGQGVSAVQLGFGTQKAFRLSKAVKGHLKDLPMVRHMRDFRVDEGHGLERGDSYTVAVFEAGDKVQVVGRSKGKGFQGVVKRHGFKGAPASHGHKDQLRMPGSIGATDAARVFKGTRMGGHMGDDQVTVKNLEVVEVRAEDGELLIKGAVPGGRGGLLMISGEGTIEIKRDEPTAEATEEESGNREQESDVAEKAVEEPKVEEKTEEAPKEEAAPEASAEEAPAAEEKKEEPAAEEAPKEEDSAEEPAAAEAPADKKSE